MEKNDIQNRDDVALLVREFYAVVRKDDLLGPIFERAIHDWEEHFETLTDFWESNLFMVARYHGDPMQKHVETDQKQGGVIEQVHFQRWLKLWHRTVDRLFVGDRASQAKNRARKMSTFMFIRIFEARKG